MAHRRARGPGVGDRLGPGKRGAHRRDLGGRDDRRPTRLRAAAVVHGRPLRGRALRGTVRRGRPRAGGCRPRRRSELPARRTADDRPGLVAAGDADAAPPPAPHAGGAPQRLAAEGIRVDGAAEGHSCAASCPRDGWDATGYGSSPATTRRDAGSRSAAAAPRAPSSPTPWPRRARSRASTCRCASAGATTSTAGSTRPRISICCAPRGWTS